MTPDYYDIDDVVFVLDDDEDYINSMDQYDDDCPTTEPDEIDSE